MKNAAYVLRLALTLLLITAAVAGALAGVNALTRDKIAAIAAEKTQKAVSRVLDGEAIEVSLSGDTGMVRSLYKSEYGYAVEVVTAGFGGDIRMMVGISKDGAVTGIDVISHAETAGLGSVAAEGSSKGEAFREQYTGHNGSLAVDKDGGTIDSITSATITSRAVTAGVNAALEFIKNYG